MKEKNILVFYDKTFDFVAPLKCLGHPQGFPDNTLRTVAVAEWLAKYGLWSKCSPERRMVGIFVITD